MKSNIRFFFPESMPTLRHRGALKSFLTTLARKEKKNIGSLVYIFCDDQYLLGINKDFLNHSDLTDIISFSYAPDLTSPIEGEIYISVQRVKENARLFQTPIHREIHRVVFHGLLHLCGYKDKLKEDQSVMRKKEELYLDLYFNRT